MAQKFTQNTAQSGGMEKDVDSRLLTANQYRDLLNGNVGRSEGANVGVIENSRGNELLASVTQQGITGTTIGTVVVESDRKLYWAVTSATVDAWYEYDAATDEISTVIIDSRTTGSVLNFSTDNLITGINVIDGLLYWTDDSTEPKKVNIEKFKAATHTSGTTSIFGRSFLLRDITVIRPHPTVAPSLLLTTDGSIPVVGGNVVVGTTPFLFSNARVTCTVDAGGAVTVSSTAGTAVLAPGQVNDYGPVAVATPRNVSVTVTGTVPSGFVGAGGNFSLLGTCPTTQPAGGTVTFGQTQADDDVTCSVDSSGNVTESSATGFSVSLSPGQARILPPVTTNTPVIVRVRLSGVVPAGFINAGDTFQFDVNCSTTQPAAPVVLPTFVFSSARVTCSVNSQTGAVTVRSGVSGISVALAAGQTSPFGLVSTPTPRSINVSVTGTIPAGFASAGDPISPAIQGVCNTTQPAQVLGNFAEADWTGGVTVSALGQVIVNQGNSPLVLHDPTSFDPNTESQDIMVTVTLTVRVPSGFDNSGQNITVIRTVPQDSSLPEFTADDWTGVVSVSQGGSVTSTQGNGSPVTILTTSVPANTAADQIPVTVRVRVTIPAGFRNFRQTIDIQQVTQQPGTSSLMFTNTVTIVDNVTGATVNTATVMLTATATQQATTTISVTPNTDFQFDNVRDLSVRTSNATLASARVIGFDEFGFGQLIIQISGTIGSSNQSATVTVTGAARDVSRGLSVTIEPSRFFGFDTQEFRAEVSADSGIIIPPASDQTFVWSYDGTDGNLDRSSTNRTRLTLDAIGQPQGTLRVTLSAPGFSDTSDFIDF